MTDYERGPQQLWAEPALEPFTQKVAAHGKQGGFMEWSSFHWLMLGGGAAIGVVLGIMGGGFFELVAGAVVGATLGYFLPMPFKEAYKKSLFQWFYLALLYVVPCAVIWLLPLATGALKIVLVVAVILILLSMFGG